MSNIPLLALAKYYNPTLNVHQLATEVDTGQSTTNPFILCKRVLESNDSVNLCTLNSILAFNNISITQAEFDFLLSIKPIQLPKFPFPANDQSVISAIGSATNKGKPNPKFGVYLIESLDGYSQYVGSSNNLAVRVRYYYSRKGLAETRPVAKALVNQGLHMFKVKVYILDVDKVAKLETSLSMDKLTLAFEQLMILLVKPTLNTLKVVNGSLSVHSTYKQVGKPVFIYNSNKDTLLYTSESGTQIEDQINITVHSMNRSIKSGKPMYSKYVFTRTPIDGAVVSLINVGVLREDLDWCYNNRAMLRDYTNATSNMTPIILTDLEGNNKSYPFLSKRKACLYTKSYPLNRQIDQLEVIKLKLPFTYKGWLFEHNTSSISNPLTETNQLKER